MTQRMNYGALVPELTQKLSQLAGESLEESLLGLVHHRASQLNGCAFCLDMDVKKAKLRGEPELRVYHIGVWRESTLFSDQERAALEWTEALTQLTYHGIPEELYQKVKKHFTDKQLAELTFTIGLINTWNRLNVAFRTTPGGLDKVLGLDKADLR